MNIFNLQRVHVDSDEMAHDESAHDKSPHLDLPYLPSSTCTDCMYIYLNIKYDIAWTNLCFKFLQS